jgi:hypothetical protein
LHEIFVGESGGGEGFFLPSEHEWDGDCGGEAGEGEGSVGGDYAFGHDTEADAGFDVGEHGADEAGCAGENGGEAGVAASCKHGVMDSDAFTAGEDDEFFAFECCPRDVVFLGEGVFGRGDNAEGFFAKGERVES